MKWAKEPPWLAIAKDEIGVHETPGPASTERIIEYNSTTTLKATSDEVPWCSAFVNWCIIQAGLEGTNSAAAVSWLKWGRKADIKNAKSGDVVIFQWGNGKHHVGFYVEKVGSLIKCLGGNQSDQVKYSWYLKLYILGIRTIDT